MVTELYKPWMTLMGWLTEPGDVRGGPGGIPILKRYRYVPPQGVWFLRRFGLKTSIDFAHTFVSGIGYGSLGNYGSAWT